MERIDARGKPCPQPVVMARKALEQGMSKIEILVDNAVSASNVKRFLQSQGFSVSEELHGADFILRGTGSPDAAPLPRTEAGTSQGKGYAVFIQSNVLGFPDTTLGEGLVKAFLSNLADRGETPSVVALMNGGDAGADAWPGLALAWAWPVIGRTTPMVRAEMVSRRWMVFMVISG